jgi:hypothetical protein
MQQALGQGFQLAKVGDGFQSLLLFLGKAFPNFFRP